LLVNSVKLLTKVVKDLNVNRGGFHHPMGDLTDLFQTLPLDPVRVSVRRACVVNRRVAEMWDVLDTMPTGLLTETLALTLSSLRAMYSEEHIRASREHLSVRQLVMVKRVEAAALWKMVFLRCLGVFAGFLDLFDPAAIFTCSKRGICSRGLMAAAYLCGVEELSKQYAVPELIWPLLFLARTLCPTISSSAVEELSTSLIPPRQT